MEKKAYEEEEGDTLPNPEVVTDRFMDMERKLFSPESGYQGCKYHFEILIILVPPQEGGIDYKEQYELMQLANLALLDQISLLQNHTGMMKDLLEVSQPTLSL